MKTLATKVTTKQKKKDGIITISVDDSNAKTVERECSNNTNLLLPEIFTKFGDIYSKIYGK